MMRKGLASQHLENIEGMKYPGPWVSTCLLFNFAICCCPSSYWWRLP